jgi:pectate lyase
MCPVTSETSYAMVMSSVISTSSTYQSAGDPIGVLPNGIGSRYLVLTVITATAHQYAGGYVVATAHKDDGVQIAGYGNTYRIKDNTATTTSTPYYSKFELYDQLVATIPTSAFITIAGCKFHDLVPGKAVALNSTLPAGVATRTQTAAAFGWVQTRGIGGALVEGAAGGSAGDIAVLSSGMAGGATILALGTTMGVLKNIVGALCAGASGSTITLMDIAIGA